MNPAVDESDAAVGGGGDFGAMGDEDHGGFLLAGEPGDEVDDGGTGSGVEVASGFVGQQDRGLMDEGAGEGGALHLAAGELMRAVVGAIGESDGGEEFAGSLPAEGIGPAGEQEGEEDVFLDGQRGEEVKELEHKTDLEASKGGEFGIVERVEGVSLEVGLTGRGGI